MLKVLIQVSAGSCEKKIYNEKTLEYKGTRRISQPYPYPYGFILETSAGDGDNLDCYLITREKLQTGAIVACEPVGLLEQHEDDEIDHKILAVLPGQVFAMDENLLKELQYFIYAVFTQYPHIKIQVGPLLSREAALEHIQECHETKI